MAVPIKMILKEIGSRINNIGTIVDTDPNNDETTSYMGKMLKGTGSFGGGLKDISNLKDNFKNSKDAADAASTAKDAADAASAAKDVAAAVSDKNIKDVENTKTADIIEKAYKGLDSIIYRYNQKGQSLGEDDKLRAGVTAQSLQGSILESNVFKDPESGYLKVDTAQQTLANTAAIKILFEKIDELEKLIRK